MLLARGFKACVQEHVALGFRGLTCSDPEVSFQEHVAAGMIFMNEGSGIQDRLFCVEDARQGIVHESDAFQRRGKSRPRFGKDQRHRVAAVPDLVVDKDRLVLPDYSLSVCP